MAIYVIDEMMGRGKTFAAINYVNRSTGTTPFLFVVSSLDEVDRICAACAEKEFVAPSELTKKLKNIKTMIQDGDNIATTYALFRMLGSVELEMLWDNQYTLILDGVTDIASQIDITTSDIELVTSEFAHIGEDKRLVWDDQEYYGLLADYKRLINAGEVYAYSDSYWVHLLPKNTFSSFKDIFILTYMFNKQPISSYFDLYNIEYHQLFVNGRTPETYCFSESSEIIAGIDYRSKILIEQNIKLNSIGEDNYALSKQWYLKHTYKPEMTVLRNSTLNFFRNYAKTPSSKNMWATFNKDSVYKIDWFKLLSGGGYSRGAVACNMKNTNNYRNKTSLAYLTNRFPVTSVYNFLSARGIQINREDYALCEITQWVWRSAIRDGADIHLYIPSRRMRTLLEQWLDRLAEGGDMG